VGGGDHRVRLNTTVEVLGPGMGPQRGGGDPLQSACVEFRVRMEEGEISDGTRLSTGGGGKVLSFKMWRAEKRAATAPARVSRRGGAEKKTH